MARAGCRKRKQRGLVLCPGPSAIWELFLSPDSSPGLICLCCLVSSQLQGSHLAVQLLGRPPLTACSDANSWYSHKQQNPKQKGNTSHLMTPLKIIMESVISSSMAAFDHIEETKKVSICNQRKRERTCLCRTFQLLSSPAS